MRKIQDPVVGKVRRYRDEQTAKNRHDLKRIVEALRERERESERPLLDP